ESIGGEAGRGRPLPRGGCSSLTGKVAAARRRRRAVSEGPRTTIRVGRWFGAAAETRIATGSASIIATSANVWTHPRQVPYDRGSAELPTSEGIKEQRNMHDTSASGRLDPAIALSGVNLSLRRGADRAPILTHID